MSKDPRGRKGRSRELRVIEGGRRGAEREPAPPRRPAPTRRVKIRRRVALAVLVLMAAGLITYVLLGPVTRLIDSRNNLARAEDQLAEEKSRTEALEERQAWDLTDRFVEWEARKMGYVKPGEIPIIVLDEEEEHTPESTPASPAP